MRKGVFFFQLFFNRGLKLGTVYFRARTGQQGGMTAFLTRLYMQSFSAEKGPINEIGRFISHAFSRKLHNYRGAATGEKVGGKGTQTSHFNFQTKQGPTVSVSNIRNIDFYGYLGIMRTRNLTIFTVSATMFGQLTGLC